MSDTLRHYHSNGLMVEVGMAHAFDRCDEDEIVKSMQFQMSLIRACKYDSLNEFKLALLSPLGLSRFPSSGSKASS